MAEESILSEANSKESEKNSVEEQTLEPQARKEISLKRKNEFEPEENSTPG